MYEKPTKRSPDAATNAFDVGAVAKQKSCQVSNTEQYDVIDTCNFYIKFHFK